MASTQKTTNLKLNQWIGTDVPKRQDFVDDNQIIDQTLGEHMGDLEQHLSTADRTKLNNLFFSGAYFGDGTSSREITLAERPSFLILYPLNYPMGKTEFQGELHFNNFGFTTQGVGSFGLTLRDKTLTVTQNAAAEYTYEVRRFNQTNVTYQYIAFR